LNNCNQVADTCGRTKLVKTRTRIGSMFKLSRLMQPSNYGSVLNLWIDISQALSSAPDRLNFVVKQFIRAI
jgi:hypothetical protein